MRRRTAILAFCALFAVALPAQAQSASEVAAARALFRDGLSAAREGRWQDARERFERSYAIAPRATTLLNLAGAQVQTGRLVAGAESYRRFLAEAQSGREASYRAQAESALAEVERRIAHVVIHVNGLRDAHVVSVDDEALPHAALGIDLPVDPGMHTVVARLGERELAREVAMLGEGERREIRIDAVDLGVARSTGPAASSVPDAALQADAETPAGPSDDTALFVGIGIGIGVVVLAAAAVGTGFAVDAANAPYSGNFGPGSIQFE